MPPHEMPPQLMPPHETLPQLMPPHETLPQLIEPQLMLPHEMPPQLMLPGSVNPAVCNSGRLGLTFGVGSIGAGLAIAAATCATRTDGSLRTGSAVCISAAFPWP